MNLNLLEKSTELIEKLKAALNTLDLSKINFPLIAACIGAMAALTAQIVSHFFAQKRENEKNVREIYQKLFAPIILDVIAYFDIATHFRKGHDIKENVDEKTVLSKINRHIENNLMYASPNLIKKFHSVKKNEYLEDFSDGLSKEKDLELCLAIIEELYEHTKKMKLFDREFKIELENYKVLYLIWIASLNWFSNWKYSINLMSYSFFMDRNKMRNVTYKKMYNSFYKKTIKDTLIKFGNKILFRKTEYKPYSKKDFMTLLNCVIKDDNYVEMIKIIENISKSDIN